MARTQYFEELEGLRANIIEMGETTQALLSEALRAITEPSPVPSALASELEARTDHQHRLIHDQCLNLITLQAPVARDARLITGILDAIVDLELIGDYSYEIVTLCSSIERRPPAQIVSRIAEVGNKIHDLLVTAVGAWRRPDRAEGFSIRPQQASIRTECESLYEKIAQLASTPRQGTTYVDLMLICKHLERILRHAVSVADEAAQAAPMSHSA